MPRYEIYKANRRTGDKKKIGDITAPNKKTALKKMSGMARITKGMYLVIPTKIRSNYTIYKP